MEYGPRIGEGQTASVYAVDDARVLKLFDAGTAEAAVRRESTHTDAAAAAGLPVPRVYDVRTVDGRPGIVFERVTGETMLERTSARPWTVRTAAHAAASLHATIHDASPVGLPSTRERLARHVESAPGVDGSVRERALELLESLPDGDSLCHGDFHPGNVVLAADGPVVIDWPDATAGHPAADVARTLLLLAGAPAPGGRIRGAAFRAWTRAFRAFYLRRYLSETGVTRDQVDRWLVPVAVARVSEGVPEEEWLREFVAARLDGA